MILVRLLPILLLLPGFQDPPHQIQLKTRDGQIVAGVPSFASVSFESAMGTVEIKLKDLAGIRFQGDKDLVTGRDRTTLTGKLQLKEVKVKGLLGEITVKTETLTAIDVQQSAYQAPADEGTSGREYTAQVRMKDGNILQGPIDLAGVTLESTLGRFEVKIAHLNALVRAKDKVDLHLKDGSLLRGAARIPEFKVRTGLGEFVIKEFERMNVHEVARAKPQPRGPAPQAPSPAQNPAVQPQSKVGVGAVLGEFTVSKDGTKLYAINRSDGKLCRWRLPGLEEDGSVALIGVEKALSLDPTGSMIFAAGEKTVTLVTAEPLAVKKSFSIELPIQVICAVDGETILGSGQGIYAISISKTAVTRKFPTAGLSPLVLDARGERIMTGSGVFVLRPGAGGRKDVDFYGLGSPGMYGGSWTVASPDGRFACGNGLVFRLGRCWAAQSVAIAPIDQHLTSAFNREGTRLYLFTQDGFVKIFDTSEFKLLGSHLLGLRVAQAALSPDGASLILAASSLEPQGRRGFTTGLGLPVDLYRFDVPK